MKISKTFLVVQTVNVMCHTEKSISLLNVHKETALAIEI